jgi:hypothetical protein
VPAVLLDRRAEGAVAVAVQEGDRVGLGFGDHQVERRVGVEVADRQLRRRQHRLHVRQRLEVALAVAEQHGDRALIVVGDHHVEVRVAVEVVERDIGGDAAGREDLRRHEAHLLLGVGRGRQQHEHRERGGGRAQRSDH